MIDIELPIYWTQEFKTKNNKTVLVGMNLALLSVILLYNKCFHTDKIYL